MSARISLIHEKQVSRTEESSACVTRAGKAHPPSRGSSFHRGFDSAVEKFGILNAPHPDSVLYIDAAANRVSGSLKVASTFGRYLYSSKYSGETEIPGRRGEGGGGFRARRIPKSPLTARKKKRQSKREI